MATTPERETDDAIQPARASGTEAPVVVVGHDPPGEWPGPPAPTPQEIRDWWEQEQRDRRFYQADPAAYAVARRLRSATRPTLREE
jgi:hypothetical protein